MSAPEEIKSTVQNVVDPLTIQEDSNTWKNDETSEFDEKESLAWPEEEKSYSYSSEQRSTIEVARKLGLSYELKELWWHKRRAEDLAWIEEEVKKEQSAITERKNNEDMCRQKCEITIEENRGECLCFCGRHRESCPIHKETSGGQKKQGTNLKSIQEEQEVEEKNLSHQIKNTLTNEEQTALPAKKEKIIEKDPDKQQTNLSTTSEEWQEIPSTSKERSEINTEEDTAEEVSWQGRLSDSRWANKPQPQRNNNHYSQAMEKTREMYDLNGNKLTALKKGLCFHCGKRGHIAVNCWNRLQGKEAYTWGKGKRRA